MAGVKDVCMPKQDLAETERTLKALANRRRLALVAILKKGSGIDVSGLANTIKMSVRATSRHLTMLEAAQILTHDQHGLHIFYSISTDVPDMARRVIDAL